MRAGLLDRAERLFSELVERDAHTPAALQHLLSIYQQERDWNKAIDIARRLEQQVANGMGGIMAHFCCELAEEAAAKGNPDDAVSHLRQARGYNKSCVRARIIEARLREQQQDNAAAVNAYKAALDLDKDYLPEILDPLLKCMQAEGQQESIEGLLEEYAGSYEGVSPVLALAEAIERNHSREKAIEFLVGKLQQRPTVRGLEHLINMNAAEPNSVDDTNLSILRDLSRNLLINQPIYRCEHCGFSGQQHHWQCPSCKFWDSTKRIRGVTGE
jgi:lipopolysaccharide biosynthesis regulator YciM